MNGIDKIIAHIRAESDAECEEIAKNAAEECERICTEYSRTEQEEYWKSINAGSKQTEHRLVQLSDLAEKESKKQLLSTKDEMVDEAFALAAKKLLELPKKEYNKLLAKLAIKGGCSAEDLVERYKAVLSPQVKSLLFD